MQLLFPDWETFRLALTSGEVPDSIALAPVNYEFEEDAGPRIHAKLPSARVKSLRKLGVKTKSTGKCSRQATNWLELLPLHRVEYRPEADAASQREPVLFEMTESDQLSELVGEMLRLGNERQSYCHYNGEHESPRTFLQVHGPPYYTTLRAIDARDENNGLRAFRRVKDRVWVELGFAHVLEDKIAPPAEQWLLIDSAGQWRTLEQKRFRDVYDIVEFQLPASPVDFSATELPEKISVPLRVARSTTREVVSLWVISRNAIATIEQLVSTQPENVISRLAFSVVERTDDDPLVILRVRPGPADRPVLVIAADEYVSYLKISNLFVPVGTRLHPPVRRDVVQELLAADASRLYWLELEGTGGAFVPKSVPDLSFRPLTEWVNYIISKEQVALEAWSGAMLFDFDDYICGDAPAKTKKKKKPERVKREIVPREEPPSGRASEAETDGDSNSGDEQPDVSIYNLQPTEAQIRLRELEREFMELDSPPDAPERDGLWREMATLQAICRQSSDLTICFANLLWNRAPTESVCREWYDAEWKRDSSRRASEKEVDAKLEIATSTASDFHGLVAWFVGASVSDDSTVRARASERLGRFRAILEGRERFHSARVVWLGWTAVDSLAGGDELALARARDSILESLFQNGLSADRELPGFLRAATGEASDRFRGLQDRVQQLRGLIQIWCGDAGAEEAARKPVGKTKPIADLVFAYVFARLGDAAAAEELMASAKILLSKPKGNRRAHKGYPRFEPTHELIGDAYLHRVRQALANEELSGGLPAAIRDRIEELDPPGNLRPRKYAVDRLRHWSALLEPHERIEPFRHHLAHQTVEMARLRCLHDVEEREHLVSELEHFLGQLDAPQFAAEEQERFQHWVLRNALELSYRVGESFALRILELTRSALSNLERIEHRCPVLERCIELAAHYGQNDFVNEFVDEFRDLLQQVVAVPELRSKHAQEAGDALRQAMKSMRRMGLKTDMARLLESLASAFRDVQWQSAEYQIPLAACEGWYYFGMDERCEPYMKPARDTVLSSSNDSLAPRDRTAITCAYLSATGCREAEDSLTEMLEVFSTLTGPDRLKLPRKEEAVTISNYFSLSQVRVIEAVALAIVGENLSLDREARRWLDDEEFRIRHRIHNDVRHATGM